jgi:tetratricopeptide (TPR) repeat protein
MFKSRYPTVHTSLLLIGLMAMSLGSGMGRSAIADGIPGVTMGTETGAPPATAEPNETVDNRNQAYTQAMLIGYAAAEQEDYQTALINFRRALNERPGDRYALAAIANMETYIARQRQEAARKRQLVALQDRVEVAVSARDWACAAATIDEMIMLVPANSLEKTRLVTYRGELSSLLDAREDAEQWSSICPG